MNNEIKVQHFIHSLVSGGAEKQLALLCQGMETKNIKNTVFCVDSKGRGSLYKDTKILVSTAPSGFSLAYFKQIFNAISESKADIVHVWLPAVITIPTLILAKSMGKKVIFSFRNRMFFHRLLSYPEYLVALLFADKIVSNHEISDSSRWFKWLYNIKRGQVICNAVEVGDLKREKLKKVYGVTRFIFVGRLTNQKNPIKLIESLSLIKHRHWILDIYGEGKLESVLIDLVVKKSLDKNVFLHGFSENIYSKMINADALLFPSNYEGMPNVLIEAMRMRLPVLASSIDANKRVINNLPDFYWLNPNNVKEMANTINSFLDSTDITKLVDQCELIAKNYSIENMTIKYEKLYLESIGNVNEVTY